MTLDSKTRTKIAEGVYLDEAYWDCDCEQDFIHRKTEFQCERCNVVQSDAPDSRSNEINSAGYYGCTEYKGFTLTVVSVITATVFNDPVYIGSLVSDHYRDGEHGMFIYDVIEGKDATQLELDILDQLLCKNNSDLKGVIYELYREAVAYRSVYRQLIESENMSCEPHRLSELYEEELTTGEAH